MSKTIEITNGPSREELFDGLRLLSEKRLIPFCIKMEGTERFLAVFMNSIQAEDGSGQSWNLIFYAGKYFLSEQAFADKNKQPTKQSGVYATNISFESFRQLAEEDYLLQDYKEDQVLVKAYYSTKTRKGTITID